MMTNEAYMAAILAIPAPHGMRVAKNAVVSSGKTVRFILALEPDKEQRKTRSVPVVNDGKDALDILRDSMPAKKAPATAENDDVAAHLSRVGYVNVGAFRLNEDGENEVTSKKLPKGRIGVAVITVNGQVVFAAASGNDIGRRMSYHYCHGTNSTQGEHTAIINKLLREGKSDIQIWMKVFTSKHLAFAERDALNDHFDTANKGWKK